MARQSVVNWVLQQDINAANRANERRYRQIVGELGDLRDRAVGAYDGQLAAEQAAINRRFDSRQGSNRAEMIRRGFGGSTALATMAAGIGRQRSTALSEAAARFAGRRAAADIQTTGMLTGAIERRQDVGPNIGAFANAAYQQGQADVPVSPPSGGNQSTGGSRRRSSGGRPYSAFREAVRGNFENRADYRRSRNAAGAGPR